MIRAETEKGWLLITHQDHARLAGKFARAWGNALFAAPEPREAVAEAVARHDDGWVGRDAKPSLTPEGRPSAFSKELVGTYAAFEEVGIEDYLRVRGEATEAVAKDSPYAAVLVSMHTVNLLTQQMDASTLSERARGLHAAFVAGQRARQAELIGGLAADPAFAEAIQPEALERGFKFLQCCDNLSLLACAAFPKASQLRHAHPARDGTEHSLLCEPVSPKPEGFDVVFRISPSPFGEVPLEFTIPCREVAGKTFGSDEEFAALYAAAPVQVLRGRIC